MEKRILTIDRKEDAIVLRQKTADIDFSRFTQKELRALTREMRLLMQRAEGVGLSANQAGLNLNLFVARVHRKFYAVCNPRITKVFSGTDRMEEGCLSVPGVFGIVERPSRIVLEGQDIAGKKIKIKAHGFLARVFQHEIDHLHGVLFIDKAKEIYTIKNP